MTDMEKITQFVFAFPVPFYARGMLSALLTRENIRRVYETIGGEPGMREVFDAFINVGGAEDEEAP